MLAPPQLLARHRAERRAPAAPPDEPAVCQYPEGAERATVDAGPQTTPLTAWLEYVSTLWSGPACETATDGAAPDASPDAVRKAAKCPCEKCVALRTLYADMPTEHTYEKKQKRWRLRGRDTPGHTPIGRVYTLHPSAGEPFFLRTLLCCAIKGSDLALDFDSEENSTAEEREADQFTLEALKYDESGVKHESYQAACEARRLLVDDGIGSPRSRRRACRRCRADPRDVHVHRRPQRGGEPVGAAQQDGRRGGHADLAQMADDFDRRLTRENVACGDDARRRSTPSSSTTSTTASRSSARASRR